MKKLITPKKAYKAMRTIQKYCNQSEQYCSQDCIFYHDRTFGNCCLLANNINPIAWNEGMAKVKVEKCKN